jgi:hypothetical protein
MTVKASMIFILSVAMIGCAAPSKVLIHPSTKQKANCSTWGFGFVGTPAAIALYMKCINEHKALGYIPIEEYENKKVTEGEIVAEQPSISCMNPVWTENTEWTYSSLSGKNSLRVQKKDFLGGIPVYSVVNDQGKQIMINENLGICAVLNQGNIEGEFTPPLNNYDWPLTVGKKWESRSIMKTPTGSIEVATSYEVQGYGKVNVPAGAFDAYYIVGKNENGLIKVVKIWYSPQVQYYVKTITYSQEGYSIEELVSYKKGGQSTEK